MDKEKALENQGSKFREDIKEEGGCQKQSDIPSMKKIYINGNNCLSRSNSHVALILLTAYHAAVVLISFDTFSIKDKCVQNVEKE